MDDQSSAKSQNPRGARGLSKMAKARISTGTTMERRLPLTSRLMKKKKKHSHCVLDSTQRHTAWPKLSVCTSGIATTTNSRVEGSTAYSVQNTLSMWRSSGFFSQRTRRANTLFGAFSFSALDGGADCLVVDFFTLSPASAALLACRSFAVRRDPVGGGSGVGESESSSASSWALICRGPCSVPRNAAMMPCCPLPSVSESVRVRLDDDGSGRVSVGSAAAVVVAVVEGVGGVRGTPGAVAPEKTSPASWLVADPCACFADSDGDSPAAS